MVLQFLVLRSLVLGRLVRSGLPYRLAWTRLLSGRPPSSARHFALGRPAGYPEQRLQRARRRSPFVRRFQGHGHAFVRFGPQRIDCAGFAHDPFRRRFFDGPKQRFFGPQRYAHGGFFHSPFFRNCGSFRFRNRPQQQRLVVGKQQPFFLGVVRQQFPLLFQRHLLRQHAFFGEQFFRRRQFFRQLPFFLGVVRQQFPFLFQQQLLRQHALFGEQLFRQFPLLFRQQLLRWFPLFGEQLFRRQFAFFFRRTPVINRLAS